MRVIFITVAVINIIIGLKKQRAPGIAGVAFIIIFFMMTYNADGPDLHNYMYGYSNSIKGNTGFSEWGYNILMRLGNLLGFSFYSFRAVITVVCLHLLHRTIKFYHANENSLIGLYMLFLFFMDTIQLRNFVVESVLLYATRFLFDKRRFSTVKYIFCIAIAALFHSIAGIYLLLLLCKIVRRRKTYSTILFFSVAMFVFFFVFRNSLSDIVLWITQLTGVKTSYSNTVARIGFIPILCMYFGSLLVMLIGQKQLSDLTLQQIINIHIVLSLVMSLLLINCNFYRIFRNILFLTLIWFNVMTQRLHEQHRHSGFLSVCMVGLNAAWWITDVVLYNDFADIVLPILKSNLLFESGNGLFIIRSLCVVGIMLLGYTIIKKLSNGVKTNRNRLISRKNVRYVSLDK